MPRYRAPTVCPEPGCANDQPCPTHTRRPWANADQRRAGTLRGKARTARNQRVLRKHRRICHWCGAPGATQVDHVIPVAEGGTDDEANLRPIHPRPCHVEKTAAESLRGRGEGSPPASPPPR